MLSDITYIPSILSSLQIHFFLAIYFYATEFNQEYLCVTMGLELSVEPRGLLGAEYNDCPICRIHQHPVVP